MTMSGVRIALDAYGGDKAPDVNIEGAILVLEKLGFSGEIFLVGKQNELKSKLEKLNYKNERLHVVDAPEVFGMAEKPSMILRRRDTSLYRAAELVKKGEADAMVSAGNTGAVLAASLFVVGRIKGVERGAIATPIPSKNGFTIMLDCGANAEVKPEYLRDFGIMGYEYAKILGVKEPSVGLLNVGEEEEKGTSITKQAFPMLKDVLKTSFIGNVEGRDILAGDTDVIVAGGFEGNIALKTVEGAASFIGGLLKKSIKEGGIAALLGGLLLKKSLKKMKGKLNPSSVGGAFILGVKGVVTKAHGNSDAEAIMNAVRVAKEGVEKDLVANLTRQFGG